MRASSYSSSFYAAQSPGSLASAEVAIPHIVRLFDPHSMLDVGCGVGTWLSVAMRHGVTDVLGIDGPWVDGCQLTIPPECFASRDLRQPLELDRNFDVAICLEAAEHLPSSSALILVASLTSLAEVVVFSAAIPHQGGTNHVNEQWPTYWIEMFEAQNFVFIDCLRPLLWDDARVDFWYAQNMLVFVTAAKERALRERGALTVVPRSMVGIVHPGFVVASHTRPAQRWRYWIRGRLAPLRRLLLVLTKNQ